MKLWTPKLRKYFLIPNCHCYWRVGIQSKSEIVDDDDESREGVDDLVRLSDMDIGSKNVWKGLRALVVVDNPATQMVHKILLKKYVLEAQVAKNGEEAAVPHCFGARFDLLLMDKEMPVKDGVNATQELREMGLKSMIVGVTSHGPGAVRDEFIAAGLDECLMKLPGPEVVLRLINQLVVA
nr:two-component response regulator ARR22-like [Ipomoea trifida]